MTEDSAALLLMALSAFTSATILPGSSEAALLALLASGAASPLSLFIVASLANVAGSCVNWVLGRFLSRFVGRRWFPATPDQLERATRWYARWGWPSLFLSWVPIVGDPLTVVAGVLKTPLPLFLCVVTIAKAARYAALLWMARLI